MRLIIIILLLFATGLQAQQKSSIFLGDGSGSSPTFDSDSMGLVVSMGEIVIGTGSKAPGSSDSLFWNAGLFVDAPVNFSALVAGAVDSLLYIDTLGFVGKTAVVANTNIANTNLTADASRILNMSGFDLDVTGADVLFFTSERYTVLNSRDTVQLSSGDEVSINSRDIILISPDIILRDPLTLSTWDSILVRHPTTGEIQARLASTIAGSDSLGRNGTAGRIVFETATKAPNSSANLFWDNSANELGIGTTAPANQFHSHKASGANHGIFSSGSNWFAFFSSSAIDPYLYWNNSRGLHLASSTSNLGSGITEIMYLGPTGNIGTGGVVAFGTSAAKVIGIGNGTEPTTSPANMVQLWAFDVAASSELRVRDEASNVTTLSPHSFTQVKPSHPMAWAFRSHNDVLGLEINVDMFRVVQLLEELTGEKLIHIKSIK